jgi:NADH-quinone oxidoreductase subunit C
MEVTEIYNLLKSIFNEDSIELKTDVPTVPFLIIKAEKINAICLFLRDEDSMQFDSLSCLSGIDFDKDNLASVYHLYSFEHNHKLTLKVIIPKSNPVVPTVSDIWATADWHERESYDMVGIIYENHPDFRRILCPDDWEGYPLRKDYKVQEFYKGMRVPY